MQPMAPPAGQRLLGARDGRSRADYLFDFWTSFGWTLLTCGFYGFYVWYRLMERMREHNRRRLAFLEATNELAWQRAGEQGRQDELRPRFERVGADLHEMRRLSAEFRDPALWLLLVFLGSTIALLVVYWLLDADLIRHAKAEADAESQLVELLSLLGAPAFAPAAPPVKGAHQYGWRIVATVASCGLYAFWWLADLMREGNDHFRRDWAWEDAVVAALS